MTRAEIHQQLAAVHAASDDPAQELLELQRLSEMVRRFTDEQRIRAAFPGVDPAAWPLESNGRTTLCCPECEQVRCGCVTDAEMDATELRRT